MTQRVGLPSVEVVRKPYRVKVTVRNNLLLSAIEAAGYKSQSEFARDAMLSKTDVSAIVSMREAPLNNYGEFSTTAKAIMEVLGACPTDLWSDEQLTLKLKRNTGERAVDFDAINHLLESHNEAMLLPNPESLAMELDTKHAVDAALDTLLPSQRAVLKARFEGEETYEEIGKKRDVTGERIRQIEAQALRKLRKPHLSNKLREHLE